MLLLMSDLIHRLQVRFPRGAPLGSAALGRLGISNDLSAQYVRSGWLLRLGRGVFMHAGDTLRLDPTLLFLESRIGGLHVAAKSALARHGFRQNIAAVEPLILWGPPKVVLPAWFSERFSLRYNQTQLFRESAVSMPGLSRLSEVPDGPLVAEPELALLEMLSEVGVHQQLEEARAIMESMRQIRAKRLLQWMRYCKMVKAVRLCAYWARQLELPWAEKVIMGVPEEMLRHRWVTRLRDGSTLSLPAIHRGAAK